MVELAANPELRCLVCQDDSGFQFFDPDLGYWCPVCEQFRVQYKRLLPDPPPATATRRPAPVSVPIVREESALVDREPPAETIDEPLEEPEPEPEPLTGPARLAAIIDDAFAFAETHPPAAVRPLL